MPGPAFRTTRQEGDRDGFFYRTTISPQNAGDRELVEVAEALGDAKALYVYAPVKMDGLHTVVGLWVPRHKQADAESSLVAKGFSIIAESEGSTSSGYRPRQS